MSRDPKTLELLARPMADLTRNRIGEAAEMPPEAAFARISGYTRRGISWKAPKKGGTP